MQYSVALLLGLAGSCRVAAFGTMPDLLSSFKDAKISTKGESAGGDETIDRKLDPHFCTNAISKHYLGSDYCYTINHLGPGACGSGSDVYRRGDNQDGAPGDKFDVCQWRCNDDGSGWRCGCKAAGVTYVCGDKCFPTAQSMTESTSSQCGEDEVLVECGPLEDCVSTDYEAVCDKTNVGKFHEITGAWVVQEKWEIKRIASRRRELHGRELQTSDTCEGLCKGVMSRETIGTNLEKVIEEKCTCSSEVGCSCKRVASVVITDNDSDITEDVAESSDDICTDDDDPICWGCCADPAQC